jgi:hypothetical protein
MELSSATGLRVIIVREILLLPISTGASRSRLPAILLNLSSRKIEELTLHIRFMRLPPAWIEHSEYLNNCLHSLDWDALNNVISSPRFKSLRIVTIHWQIDPQSVAYIQERVRQDQLAVLDKRGILHFGDGSAESVKTTGILAT